MHTVLCASYSLATPEMLILHQAPLPFAKRLLIPYLLQTTHFLLPINLNDLLFLNEVLFSFLLYFALYQLLKCTFSAKKATMLSALFFLLLPLTTVVNYRFTIGGIAPFAYIYDTASLFFITAGFYCCLQKKWLFFYPLLFLATLNRESSLLILLLIPSLHWQDKKNIIYPGLISLLIFLAAKLIVYFLTAKLSGNYLVFYKSLSSATLFTFNLEWLFNKGNILIFIFCSAGLPFLWFTFYDYIPLQFRPLRYLCFFYFIGLLCVGIFPETRIFSELLILWYLPVCIAVDKWLLGEKISINYNISFSYLIFRYGVLIILCAIVLFYRLINIWVVKLAINFFPN